MTPGSAWTTRGASRERAAPAAVGDWPFAVDIGNPLRALTDAAGVRSHCEVSGTAEPGESSEGRRLEMQKHRQFSEGTHMGHPEKDPLTPSED